MNKFNQSSTSIFILAIVLFISIIIIIIDFGCTKEGPAGIAGPAGNSDLIDPTIQPSVIETAPTKGSTGPFDLFSPGLSPYSMSYPNFVIQFNKLMNTNALNVNSVRVQGFDRPIQVYLFPYYRIYPINGTQYLNIESLVQSGPFENILTFAILDSVTGEQLPYRIGMTYKIIIDSSVVDINGNHLKSPYEFSYTPEPYFRVTALSPTNGSTNISQDFTPRVAFNSPLDASLISKLHISPAMSGKWTLTPDDSLIVSFGHLNSFSYNSTYTFSVDGDARDATGNLIHSQVTSTFTTEAFGIQETYPSNGATITNLNNSIEFDFTGLVDTASLRSAFSITPNTLGVLTISSDYLTYYPISTWMPDTTYTITVSTVLQSIDSIHLSTPFIYKFSTPKFQISSTSPADGSIDISRSLSIYIYCISTIDPSSIQGAVHISPGNPPVLTDYGTYFSFTPTELAAETIYTVTIDSTLRSISGYTIGKPYTFSFKTGE